jgi:hypothetical protein
VPEPSEDVIRELYSVPPDEFTAKRNELAATVRKDGDAAAAQAIGKLRKPTVGAYLVNALVHEDSSVVEDLADVGDRMRAAQDALDAGTLRELSTERRKLVAKLTTAALKKAGRKDPPAALRDEVSGTFDAAIADADIAARLGRLQRAEQWSGFGFMPSGSPQLTVVRGGRAEKAAKKAPAKPKLSAAEKRKRQRTLTSARSAFDKAESALDDANRTERQLVEQVRQLTRKIAKLQGQLDDARDDLEQARKDTSSAKSARRDARTTLDKAERDADGS